MHKRWATRSEWIPYPGFGFSLNMIITIEWWCDVKRAYRILSPLALLCSPSPVPAQCPVLPSPYPVILHCINVNLYITTAPHDFCILCVLFVWSHHYNWKDKSKPRIILDLPKNQLVVLAWFFGVVWFGRIMMMVQYVCMVRMIFSQLSFYMIIWTFTFSYDTCWRESSFLILWIYCLNYIVFPGHLSVPVRQLVRQVQLKLSCYVLAILIVKVEHESLVNKYSIHTCQLLQRYFLKA